MTDIKQDNMEHIIINGYNVRYNDSHLKISESNYTTIKLDFHQKQNIKYKVWGDTKAVEIYPKKEKVLDYIEQIHLFNLAKITLSEIEILMTE